MRPWAEDSYGWQVQLAVRVGNGNGYMIAPMCHTEDRDAAIEQAYAWAASLGHEVTGVREVVRVASRGLDKRV